MNKLKTANDYLKYNLQGVIDEESDSPSTKIELKDVPKDQHAAVKSVVEMLGKRIDDLEKNTAKSDWKGGDITGIYAVHRSPKDKTPVGYVVTARADYDYDGWTEWAVAVSLNGKTIVDRDNVGP